MRLRSNLLALTVAALPLAACDTGTTPLGGFDDAGCNGDTEGNTSVADSAADGPPADQGIAIDCSFPKPPQSSSSCLYKSVDHRK